MNTLSAANSIEALVLVGVMMTSTLLLFREFTISAEHFKPVPIELTVLNQIEALRGKLSTLEAAGRFAASGDAKVISSHWVFRAEC